MNSSFGYCLYDVFVYTYTALFHVHVNLEYVRGIRILCYFMNFYKLLQF